MAVAFDAIAIPSAALYTATFSWTHTPVGAPKGVAVIVVQEGSTDQVSGVTYGGYALTRVRSDVRTVTEPGRVYIYFLGSGIPTGAQAVQVTLTGAADTNAVSLTVTSAADTAVDAQAGLDAGIIANPSLTIVPTVQAVIFYGIFSGLAAPVTTVQTGSTHVAGKDYGTDSAMWARKSVASGGSTTIGYTAASDDVCHSALAIKEAVADLFITPTPIFALAGIIIPAVILGSLNIIASALSAIGITVNPLVILGSLGITPVSASAVQGGADPTVQIETPGVTVTPTPIFALGSKVNPIVILGSLILTPNGLGSVASIVSPTVLLGSLVIIPSTIDVYGGRTNPTVVLGSISITPDTAWSIAGKGDPVVDIGGGAIFPVAAFAVGNVASPQVELGSTIAIPSPIAVISDRANPDVVLGSLLISPGVALAVPSSRQFTYQLPGKVHRKYKLMSE